ALDRALQMASKQWKAVVHVDHHHRSTWPQQAIDVCSTVQRASQPVAVAEGVDSKNEVKCFGQFLRRTINSCGEIRTQPFVSGDVEAHFVTALGRKKRAGFLCGCFDE